MGPPFSILTVILPIILTLSCKTVADQSALRIRYRPRSGEKCTGGTSQMVGEEQTSVPKCAQLCDSNRDCFGFNWSSRKGGSCYGMTNGCVIEKDEDSVFFARKPPRSALGGKQLTRTEYRQLASAFPNYVLQIGRRCSGGRRTQIGKLMKDLQDCKTLCDSSEGCIGFNWRSPKLICIVRNKECKMGPDALSIFFRKNDANVTNVTKELRTTSVPRKRPSQKVLPRPDFGDWERSRLFPDYEVIMYRSCMGERATLIGDAQSDSIYCATLCDERPDCFGFVWYPRVKNCVTRTTQCTVVREKTGALLYRKSPKRKIPPLQTSAGHGSSERPRLVIGFEIEARTRCFGGTSLPIGDIQRDRDLCAYQCQMNRNCAGFNYKISDGMCALRSLGCQEVPSGLFAFYRRSGTTEATTPMNITLPPVTLKRNVLRNFYVKPNTRCSGGTSLALLLHRGLDECAESCTANEECYGFNYIETGECTLRTAGCIEEKETNTQGVSFYGKARQEL